MIRSLLVASVLLLGSPSLYALGLGEIELDSRLNQPLKAKIPVVLDEDTSVEDLTINLANQARFEKAGIKRGVLAMSLKFVPVQEADGKPYILVMTKSRVLEPMLKFVLEVEQNGVRTLREYAALIESPMNQ